MAILLLLRLKSVGQKLLIWGNPFDERPFFGSFFCFDLFDLPGRDCALSGMDFRQRIRVCRVLHLPAGKVGVYFRRAEVFMAKDILEHPDIHLTMLVHQGGGGVPQFVGGVAPIP